MLWAATVLASFATAAAPSPQLLVLRPADVPAGFKLVPAASGRQPEGYRNTFDGGRLGTIASVAAVYPSARDAQRVVDVPASQCGRPGTTPLRVGAPFAPAAAFCLIRAKGKVAFVLVWHHGRVFGEVVLAGPPEAVSAAKTIRLARLQERHIANALAPALAA